jgi:hypothetical protein
MPRKKYTVTLVNVTTVEIEADYLDQASALADKLVGDKLLDVADQLRHNETGWRPIRIGNISLLYDNEYPIDPKWRAEKK